MNELALFAGAGGGILGGKLLGWRTVCAVELEPYPASVLAQRQNDGLLAPFPIWDDVCTFNGKPWKGIVDVVSGGFPCQDISIAGKGAGLAGAKSGLWGEMRRIISEVRPKFVLVENSPMLTIRGGTRVIADLAEMGYDCRWGVIGAADAGAYHERNRLWIVANANGAGFKEYDLSSFTTKQGFDTRQDSKGQGKVSYTTIFGLQRINESRRRAEVFRARVQSEPSRISFFKIATEMANSYNADGLWKCGRERSCETCKTEWDVCTAFDQPEPIRMVDGLAARVDRLKAVGNGQVPAVVRLAWNILTEGW